MFRKLAALLFYHRVNSKSKKLEALLRRLGLSPFGDLYIHRVVLANAWDMYQKAVRRRGRDWALANLSTMCQYVLENMEAALEAERSLSSRPSNVSPEDWADLNSKFEAVKLEYDRIVEYIVERKGKG